MTHLLDANSCIHSLRYGTASSVTLKLAAAPVGSVVLCAVVVAELLYGVHRSQQQARNLAQVQTFCRGFLSLPFGDRAAEEYGKLRAYLTQQGTPIGPNDLLIAAIALAHGLILVTNNTAEFCRVPGLRLEDWQQP